MYCSACGIALTPGLSFCNRCGASLKQQPSTKLGPIAAYLTAITLIGIAGLGIMLGGTALLKTEANLKEELLGVFMLFTFSIVALIEILLIRQLSRLTRPSEQTSFEPQQQFLAPPELRAMSQRALPEQMGSVTENTTRTLEYVRNESSK